MKKVFLLVLLLVSVCICTGCGKTLNNFEEYEITEEGVLKWNKVKEAKYYYIECGSKEVWSEKNQYDISSFFEEKDEKFVEVWAFTSKSLLGALEVDPLNVQIIKLNDKFLEVDSLSKQTVYYSYIIDGKSSSALTSKGVTSYKAPLNPDLVYSELNSNYTVDSGCYYDSACTKKVESDNGYFYPTETTTLYRKATTKTASIKVYTVTSGSPVLYKTLSYKYGSTISNSDITKPTFAGYTYDYMYRSVLFGTSTFDTSLKVSGDMSLYIKYKKIS